MRNVVALLGGLGNQLFQVGFGRWLEQQTGWETHYDISRLWVPGDILRLGGLGQYLRERSVVRTGPGPAPRSWTARRIAGDRSSQWPTRVVSDLRISPGPHAPLEPFTPDISTPAWWYGRWGREEYAVTLIPILAEALEEVPRPSSTPLRGVSVRRGDMLDTPFAVPSNWFARAVAQLRAIEPEIASLPLKVWSDDLAWCERHLDLGEPREVAAPAGAVEQLAQLSDAAALVLSRSTFSWWAAAIASRRSIPVVYPAPWPLAARSQPKPDHAPPWIPLTTVTEEATNAS